MKRHNLVVPEQRNSYCNITHPVARTHTHTHSSATPPCSVYQGQAHRSHLPGCPGNPVTIQSTEHQLAERAACNVGSGDSHWLKGKTDAFLNIYLPRPLPEPHAYRSTCCTHVHKSGISVDTNWSILIAPLHVY